MRQFIILILLLIAALLTTTIALIDRDNRSLTLITLGCIWIAALGYCINVWIVRSREIKR